MLHFFSISCQFWIFHGPNTMIIIGRIIKNKPFQISNFLGLHKIFIPLPQCGSLPRTARTAHTPAYRSPDPWTQSRASGVLALVGCLGNAVVQFAPARERRSRCPLEPVLGGYSPIRDKLNPLKTPTLNPYFPSHDPAIHPLMQISTDPCPPTDALLDRIRCMWREDN